MGAAPAPAPRQRPAGSPTRPGTPGHGLPGSRGSWVQSSHRPPEGITQGSASTSLPPRSKGQAVGRDLSRFSLSSRATGWARLPRFLGNRLQGQGIQGQASQAEWSLRGSARGVPAVVHSPQGLAELDALGDLRDVCRDMPSSASCMNLAASGATAGFRGRSGPACAGSVPEGGLDS